MGNDETPGGNPRPDSTKGFHPAYRSSASSPPSPHGDDQPREDAPAWPSEDRQTFHSRSCSSIPDCAPARSSTRRAHPPWSCTALRGGLPERSCPFRLLSDRIEIPLTFHIGLSFLQCAAQPSSRRAIRLPCTRFVLLTERAGDRQTTVTAERQRLTFGPSGYWRRFHSARSTSRMTVSTVSSTKPSARRSARPCACSIYLASTWSSNSYSGNESILLARTQLGGRGLLDRVDGDHHAAGQGRIGVSPSLPTTCSPPTPIPPRRAFVAPARELPHLGLEQVL